jgi:hypothetical protein
MDREGWGGPAGAPDLDPGLRDALSASLAGWTRRLEALRGPAGPGPTARELAIVGKEAGDLRSLALARGAIAVARHLEAIAAAAAASGPPSALTDALDRLAQLVRLTPEPRFLTGMGNVLPASLAEPPLLDLSRPGVPVSDGTLMSARGPAQDPAGSAPPPAAPPPMSPAALERIRSAPPARLPDSMRPAQPQPAFVGTFLGFRAFGRKARDASPGVAGSAPKASGNILGLRGRPKLASNVVVTPVPPRALPRAPLPGLAVAPARWNGSPRADASPSPRQRTPSRPSVGHEASLPRWAYVIGGGLGVLAMATVLIIAWSVRSSKLASGPGPTPASSGSGATASGSPTSPTGPTVSTTPPASTAPDTLMDSFQPRGKETPELRALLETQSRLALACRSDPASCGRGWTPISRDAFNPIDRGSLQIEPVATTPLPAWLQRIKVPGDLRIRDDAVLHSMFDFDTKNIAGRQRFQAKLFECAAYDDIFDSTFVKYGAPAWLSAVVFQESGCYPRAKSEVGALGLWQFMPESARAYGLRVVDGEIDERLNPIKSTDAAVHFLTDLQRTLGAWDLVLAAYNMGPYAVLARLAQVGGNASFWDLAHAGLLPDETASYVPAIEADALALQNLSRLQFSRDGKRLEATAEIRVSPGNRLSLIARAASTTTLHIRELNPEFLRDVVPEGESSARVPDAESHRAEAFMESWSPDDNRDTCVPEDFDWGVKEFESSRFAKGCGQPANH